MRILLAHNHYSVQGGAEVFYHEIGRLLEASGHEVARFSCAEDGLDAPHAEYYPQVAHYTSGGFLAKATRVPSVIYNHAARAAMTRLIADFRPDVIHAFAIYGRLTPAILDAARAAGVPVVLSCNDYKHICPNYKLFHHGHLCEDCKGGRFYSALSNSCCHDSHAISAVSMLGPTCGVRTWTAFSSPAALWLARTRSFGASDGWAWISCATRSTPSAATVLSVGLPRLTRHTTLGRIVPIIACHPSTRPMR